MTPYGYGAQGPGGVLFMTTAAPVSGTEEQLERNNCGVGSPGITEQRMEGRLALGLVSSLYSGQTSGPELWASMTAKASPCPMA